MSGRMLVFLGVLVGAVGLGAGYVGTAALSGTPGDGEGGARLDTQGPPLLLFQRVARDNSYAHVGVHSLTGNKRTNTTKLVCERMHFAGGRGLCLMPGPSTIGWDYDARVFGPDFRVQRTINLPGLESRARVSPDGRYGATTGFVSGHSYADDSYSTQTFILDLARGDEIANLEEFAVYHDGRKVTAEDRNFWGVTFAADSNRFYATMGTGGKTYLIEGNVRRRTGRTLHEKVECPSLSPDGTRVAYKKALPDGGWRLTVLDLASLEETPTAETRSIDDQPEWLDNERILYGHEGAIWSAPADGSRQPQRLMDAALSPAVIH
jgi:WD40-like Beta Propeller Repeat